MAENDNDIHYRVSSMSDSLMMHFKQGSTGFPHPRLRLPHLSRQSPIREANILTRLSSSSSVCLFSTSGEISPDPSSLSDWLLSLLSDWLLSLLSDWLLSLLSDWLLSLLSSPDHVLESLLDFPLFDFLFFLDFLRRCLFSLRKTFTLLEQFLPERASATADRKSES